VVVYIQVPKNVARVCFKFEEGNPKGGWRRLKERVVLAAKGENRIV